MVLELVVLFGHHHTSVFSPTTSTVQQSTPVQFSTQSVRDSAVCSPRESYAPLDIHTEAYSWTRTDRSYLALSPLGVGGRALREMRRHRTRDAMVKQRPLIQYLEARSRYMTTIVELSSIVDSIVQPSQEHTPNRRSPAVLLYSPVHLYNARN